MPELLHIHIHSHVALTLIAKIHRKTADKGDNENKNVWWKVSSFATRKISMTSWTDHM